MKQIHNARSSASMIWPSSVPMIVLRIIVKFRRINACAAWFTASNGRSYCLHGTASFAADPIRAEAAVLDLLSCLKEP